MKSSYPGALLLPWGGERSVRPAQGQRGVGKPPTPALLPYSHPMIGGRGKPSLESWVTPRTSAPHAASPGCLLGLTAAGLRSGSGCLCPTGWHQSLGTEGRSQSCGEGRGVPWTPAHSQRQEGPGPPGPHAPRALPTAPYLSQQAWPQSPHCCPCPSSAAHRARRAGCWNR